MGRWMKGEREGGRKRREGEGERKRRRREQEGGYGGEDKREERRLGRGCSVLFFGGPLYRSPFPLPAANQKRAKEKKSAWARDPRRVFWVNRSKLEKCWLVKGTERSDDLALLR